MNNTETIDLDLLRDSDHSRIRYRKVAEADGQEVAPEHIVRGYEHEKGKYVVIAPQDFERVQIKSSQVVEIREFVNASDVDSRFYEKPYFLAPEKGGARAYVLLRMALEQTGLVGLAKVVIRPPREHLSIVKPQDGVLLLQTLHFADELRNPTDLEIPLADVGRKELDMALSLVKTMEDKWQPDKYRDEYREALMNVIEEKVAAGGKALPAPKTATSGQGGKVLDLVELLQRSIGETEKKRGGKKTRARTPHRKAA